MARDHAGMLAHVRLLLERDHMFSIPVLQTFSKLCDSFDLQQVSMAADGNLLWETLHVNVVAADSQKYLKLSSSPCMQAYRAHKPAVPFGRR